MNQVEQLEKFWSWLPAFRAVAECEHLSQAAKSLKTSPSSVSRSIRLLEESVGQQLFDRTGRGLRLTTAGESLLGRLRKAMHEISTGCRMLQSNGLHGPLRVSAPGAFMPLLLEAITQFRVRHPDVKPELGCVPPQDVNDRLRLGELDLALSAMPIEAPDISHQRLTEIPFGVFSSCDHPLVGRHASVEELLQYEFVGYQSTRHGDPWPGHLARKVGIRVHQVALGAKLAKEGYLAVLPHSCATDHQLTEIHVALELALPVFAVYLDSEDVNPAVSKLREQLLQP